jgi:hypothetical protein
MDNDKNITRPNPKFGSELAPENMEIRTHVKPSRSATIRVFAWLTQDHSHVDFTNLHLNLSGLFTSKPTEEEDDLFWTEPSTE